MISTDFDHRSRSTTAVVRTMPLRSTRGGAATRLALACVGVLLAGVLAPKTVLGQGGLVIPGGGGYAIPPSFVPSGPVNPWAPSGPPPEPDTHYGPGPGPGTYFGPEPDGLGCLRARALSGVVASNDREVILRFGRGVFYRVALTRACPALLGPGAHVAGVTHSSGGLICKSFDVELDVVASDGSVSHCTGDTLSKMSTAEVKTASAPRRP